MNLMPAIVMMTFSRCLECSITKICHGLFSVVSHVCATLNEDCSLVQCLSDALGEPFWSLDAAGCSNRICWWLCPAHVQLILKYCLRFSTHDNTCGRACVQDASSTSMTLAVQLGAPGRHESHGNNQGEGTTCQAVTGRVIHLSLLCSDMVGRYPCVCSEKLVVTLLPCLLLQTLTHSISTLVTECVINHISSGDMCSNIPFVSITCEYASRAQNLLLLAGKPASVSAA
jgi:hypothetical protein